MHTAPGSEAPSRFQRMKTALRRWLIRVGIAAPPSDIGTGEHQLTDEQRAARTNLVMRTLKRPPRNPMQ
jgi:hypothetical protein